MRDPLLRLSAESRRAFLEKCARTAFGVSIMPTALCSALGEESSSKSPAPSTGFGSAKSVIFIQLKGGMSHIDTFDPKTGPTKGPKGALSTKADFQVSAFLPKTATVADKISVIRSMTAKVGVHADARYVMRTGYEPRGTIRHPMLGAWAQHYLGPSHSTLPSSVSINQNSENGNGFFPATYTPLPIIDPDTGLQHSVPYAGIKTVEDRLALVREVDRSFLAKFSDANVSAYNDFYDATVRLMKSSDLRAFDLNLEPASIKAQYGDSKLGRGLLLARRLAENGVRFIEVSSNGWDMHNNLEDSMEDTGADFDQSYAALLRDLDSRGLLASTLVVVATEFGRKPEFSGSGRGHYPTVFSTVLAGAGIRRGFVYGASDKAGAQIEKNPVTVGQLHSTIAWAVGLPMDKVFVAPNGRPFSVGNKAAPIGDLFA